MATKKTVTNQADGINSPSAKPTETPTSVTGRSIFIVETIPAGISVQTSFMTEEGQFLQMPAVFPDAQYALAQIDELRKLVLQHFTQAAQVGAQVIAAQTQQAAEAAKVKAAE